MLSWVMDYNLSLSFIKCELVESFCRIRVNGVNWNRAVHHLYTQPEPEHTQQLCKVVKSLTPEEDLSIPTRVARETFLASMFALLRLDKIGWYVIVLGDNGMT